MPTTPIAETKDYDVYRSEDGSVAKYVHEDGSETAIKRSLSVLTALNPLTLKMEQHAAERNKFTIFASASVGCYMQCPFCHLTIKNCRYRKLSESEVLTNLKDALEDAVSAWPDLRDRYVKLSWMGMGDAVNAPEMVRNVSLEFLDWALQNGMAKGLDGVDLSTVLPPVKDDWIDLFLALNRELGRFRRNPGTAPDNAAYVSAGAQGQVRSPFRLFYSLHSALQATRDKVVPNALTLAEAIPRLKAYSSGGANLIFHHLLVDGLNDTDDELLAVIQFMQQHFSAHELRVLRYNFCARSPYQESAHFISQIQRLSNSLDVLKVQVSPGAEVQAACGQFIVRMFNTKPRADTKKRTIV